MGRGLTPEEVALCEQAWSRRSESPDYDFFRCPWCTDLDLSGPKTEGGEDSVGCREDACEYLIATLEDSGEIVIGDGYDILEEIAGLLSHPELGYSRDFDFLDEHPLVVSHTIIGGGVGSSWSLTCWWTEKPEDENLMNFIITYRDKLGVEAREANASDGIELDEEDTIFDARSDSFSASFSAITRAFLLHKDRARRASDDEEIRLALESRDDSAEPSSIFWQYPCGLVSDEIFVYSGKNCPRCGENHLIPGTNITNRVLETFRAESRRRSR